MFKRLIAHAHAHNPSHICIYLMIDFDIGGTVWCRRNMHNDSMRSLYSNVTKTQAKSKAEDTFHSLYAPNQFECEIKCC